MNLKIVRDWVGYQVDKVNELYRWTVYDLPKAVKHNDFKNWYEQLWRILKWRWHREE